MNLQDSSTGGTKLVGARNELRCCCKNMIGKKWKG
jgi:hypothetical protein